MMGLFRMVRGGALLVLGFTMGLTVGIVFSRLLERSDEPANDRETIVFHADPATAEPEPPEFVEPTEPAMQVPPSPTRAGADPEARTEQIGALHSRLTELEAELERVQAELESHTGARLTPPENLDARFEQAALVDSMTAAFAQQGVAGEVTTVDCTEYPCILYGRLQAVEVTTEPNLDRMLALLESPPLAAYQEDGRQLRAMVHPPNEEGQASAIFAVSWYPKEDHEAREEEIVDRFRRRFNEMFETGGLR